MGKGLKKELEEDIEAIKTEI